MPYQKLAETYSQWQKKVFSPIYLLAGEEIFFHDEAKSRLENALSVNSLNSETFFGQEASANDIILALQNLPFLSEKKYVTVKDTHKMKSAELEALAEFLKSPPSYACLLLIWAEKLDRDDKKKPLFAVTEKLGVIVESKSLYDNEYPAWIQSRAREQGKSITMGAAEYLAQESGSNLIDLSNEIEKLVLFTKSRKEIEIGDVELLCGHTRQANLNNLSEAVETRNIKNAISVMESLILEGEVPLRILATIYRCVRRLLIGKSMLDETGASYDEIRQKLKLHPYFAKGFFSSLSGYKMAELERTLSRIMHSDMELKTSARPESMIFEELLLSLAGN